MAHGRSSFVEVDVLYIPVSIIKRSAVQYDIVTHVTIALVEVHRTVAGLAAVLLLPLFGVR